MCLGIPGKIITIKKISTGIKMGKVSFGGVSKEICLEYVPEAKIGDYVVVHTGFALSIIDQKAAQETFSMLKEIVSK